VRRRRLWGGGGCGEEEAVELPGNCEY